MMNGSRTRQAHAIFRVALVTVAAACAASVAPSVLAQATLPIVQARPDTGSRVRRELARMTIPATKPYAELTAEQKAALRANFSNLAATDEPPYPLEGLLPLAESLVFVLADGKVGKGDLFMTVLVDETGEPKSTTVYSTPDSRVSREAATALMKVKYKPGTCSGKPCSAEFPFTATFVSD